MRKELNDDKIIYIGIGVFLWLTIAGFSILFENSIKDLLLNLNIQPRIILWTKLAVQLITYFLGFIVGIKIIKSSKKTNLRIFWNLILLFILGQFLQFLQPNGIELYGNENFFINSSEYYDFRSSNYIEVIMVLIFEFLSYLIVGLIIYKNR